MPAVDTTKTGRRGYATIAQVQEFADITVTDESEAVDQLSQAEELIDAWVGAQQKAVCEERIIEVKSATATTVTEVDALNVLWINDDYYKGCEVEVIGGTGIGQVRRVTASVRDTKTLTLADAWDTAPDDTSVLRIYQLAKFPRQADSHLRHDGMKYYRSVPDAVRRATCAQVQYMITKGATFFAGDDLDKQSESIGNYSYSRGSGLAAQSSRVRLMAPRARDLLRGITNRTGRIVND